MATVSSRGRQTGHWGVDGILEYLALGLTGCVYGMAGGVSPGPTTTLVVAQTLRYGVGEGAKVAIAPALTDAPIILLSLLFLRQLSQFSTALAVITFLGAGFLLFLAWESMNMTGVAVDTSSGAANSVQKGFLANLLNPHPFLFWFTVGARELLQASDRGWLGVTAFLVGMYLCLIGAKVLLAVLVGRTRNFLQSSGYVVVNRLLGLVLLGFAIRFVWEGSRLL